MIQLPSKILVSHQSDHVIEEFERVENVTPLANNFWNFAPDWALRGSNGQYNHLYVRSLGHVPVKVIKGRHRNSFALGNPVEVTGEADCSSRLLIECANRVRISRIYRQFFRSVSKSAEIDPTLRTFDAAPMPCRVRTVRSKQAEAQATVRRDIPRTELNFRQGNDHQVNGIRMHSRR